MSVPETESKIILITEGDEAVELKPGAKPGATQLLTSIRAAIAIFMIQLMYMKTPYFLWDYDLTDTQIHAILKGKNEVEKRWLIGRILTHAHYKDIFKYLTISDIIHYFSKLSLPKTVKNAWQRAFKVWGYHV